MAMRLTGPNPARTLENDTISDIFRKIAPLKRQDLSLNNTYFTV